MEATFNVVLPMIFANKKNTEQFYKNKKKTKCQICNLTFDIEKFKTHQISHPSKICDYIYLGSYQNAINQLELKKLQIKFILNCAHECPNTPIKNIRYKHIKLYDDPHCDLSQHFSAAFSFINEAINSKSNILIHCAMGVSRSSAILIAYLMKHQRMSFQDAYWFVKKRRSIIFPNFGFMTQLTEYECI